MIGQGRGHAVVIGGSVAGLPAAHVLAKHAARVTVVERNRYPEQPVARKGVPHGKHTHILLRGGLASMLRLLPGIDGDLLAARAVRVGRELDDQGVLLRVRKNPPAAPSFTDTGDEPDGGNSRGLPCSGITQEETLHGTRP